MACCSGAARETIRAGMIEDDLLEAVISLAPNLFYGTGPGLHLVLRQRRWGSESGKPECAARCCSTINATAITSRVGVFKPPEHIEKIVTTFDAYAEVPGFSAIVENATLKANDYNLNIRRYADNAPPPEPHDVRAPICWAECPRSKSPPRRRCLPRTASIR
ncbi:MAG: N-6 DNA methylase [Candidatus Competibacteraceae bacterium]